MPRIRKTAQAESDLIEIWLYTYQEWGEAQAERYFDQLESGIAQLIRQPTLGKRCDQIRSGYRAVRIGRHVVYYTTSGPGVQIVRVLHERMDPDRHL